MPDRLILATENASASARLGGRRALARLAASASPAMGVASCEARWELSKLLSRYGTRLLYRGRPIHNGRSSDSQTQVQHIRLNDTSLARRESPPPDKITHADALVRIAQSHPLRGAHDQMCRAIVRTNAWLR